jgi:hypothetical protein
MTTHSAADSASGYLYQCRYALLAALKRQDLDPGLQVSIECFDDIAFSQAGTPIELLQAKHSSKPKAMSDMAAQFWKTIGIWTKRLTENPSEFGKLKLSFVTTATLGAGSGLALLRPDKSARNVDGAQDKLETAAQASKDKNVAWAVDLFLRQTPALRRQILDMVEVLDASPTVVDVAADISFALRRACRADHLSLLVERLEGWWFSLVIDALSTDGGKLIPVSDIDSKVDDLREEFGPERLPIDYGSADPCEATIELLEGRPFVDQLKLVTIGPTGLKAAIVDYFRARQQRSRWAREGLLRHNELSNYARRLSENWARRWGRLESKITEDMSEKQLASLGQDFYAETTEACMPLREVSEPFVSHGSYHMLSDKGSIGWHPFYSKRINARPNGENDDESPVE